MKIKNEESLLEIIRRSIELLDTLAEAAEYMATREQEVGFESSVELFGDFVDGIGQLENSLDPVLHEVLDRELNDSAYALAEALETVASAFKEQNMYNAKEATREKLVPAYRQWKDALQRILRPMVVC
jgi:hypothetical protein